MARASSKRLVIDASIGRAAGGEDATHPTARACRELLHAVLRVCHRAVMTETIRAEWRKHRSRFAKSWLASMTARKKVEAIAEEEDSELREALGRLPVGANEKAALEKDVHLLEAALAADQIVLALDEQVRELLRRVAGRLGKIRKVSWANPDREQEGVVDWLSHGGRVEPVRQLGHEAEEGQAPPVQ